MGSLHGFSTLQDATTMRLGAHFDPRTLSKPTARSWCLVRNEQGGTDQGTPMDVPRLKGRSQMCVNAAPSQSPGSTRLRARLHTSVLTWQGRPPALGCPRRSKSTATGRGKKWAMTNAAIRRRQQRRGHGVQKPLLSGHSFPARSISHDLQDADGNTTGNGCR